MVGGTGLYIKAFCEGLDEIPAVDAAVRRNIVDSYKKNGLSWLQNEVREKDPAFFMSGENKNPQRLMRAFEVIVATGRSITSFRTSQKKARPFRIIKLGINLSKEKLVANIDARVDAMISAGLVDEVRALLPYRHLNALQTVGYNELFSFLDGQLSLEQATTQIKSNTRQYAKRQLTWFKKDASIIWVDRTFLTKKDAFQAMLAAVSAAG